MYYPCAIHKPFATRCQLLTFCTLVTALLFETRGLMDDLNMAGTRASVGIQLNAMPLGEAPSLPGLFA